MYKIFARIDLIYFFKEGIVILVVLKINLKIN